MLFALVGVHGLIFERSCLHVLVVTSLPATRARGAMDPLATLDLSGSEEGSEEEQKKEVKLDYKALLSSGYEEPEKLEALVQKKLVSEAWLRRIKKPNGQSDEYVYVMGSRAFLSRKSDRSDELRTALLDDKFVKD